MLNAAWAMMWLMSELGLLMASTDETNGESREDNDPALLHSYVVDENQQINNLGPGTERA